MGTAKNAFQKISNVLRERELSLRTKVCNISSLILCWTVSLKMKSPEAKKKWFYRRKTENTTNMSPVKILNKFPTTTKVFLTSTNRQLKWMDIKKKDDMGYLTQKGHNKCKTIKRKRGVIYIKSSSDGWQHKDKMG